MFTKKLMDLCKKTSCPVSTGHFVLSRQQTLPSLTPPVRAFVLLFYYYGLLRQINL
ncbi:hypothetical protein MUK42_36877 [Musa troglodytarum]|uniref:Uncharacterized protein n=1 Tax=Musa troglodytarum TaxID=320322 RepID=A0A9E7FHM2_9LILI|nr:hypothetical protein MUK42_36877 [Musa troglodytarum]